MNEIDRLKEIVEKLRSKDGCPWDRVQTHESLKAACIEEAAEVIGGINILDKTGKEENLREELGDLLLQVMFHAVIAEEEGKFTFNDVVSTINEKMIFGGREMKGTAVSMGNPHIVFYLDDIEKAPLTTMGPLIEKDERFPEGVNVEFVEVENENELHFRVWERGSGITQACGTGACAATVSSVLNGYSKRDTDITVHLAGGDLIINWKNDGRVMMTGPAETVCEGEFFIS